MNLLTKRELEEAQLVKKWKDWLMRIDVERQHEHQAIVESLKRRGLV